MRVIICGGGTAGHLYPGLALANELTSKDKVDLIFVGTAFGKDLELLSGAGYVFKTLNIKGWPRKFSLETLTTFFRLFSSSYHALKILRTFRPEVVVGMGGYASFPLVLMAVFLRIPTLIHEQNAFPGLANRILGRLVSSIAFSYAGAEKNFPKRKRKVLTGSPIRKDIFGFSRQEGIKTLGLSPARKTLLVFGGSRGAKKLNQALLEAYPFFRSLEVLQIIHLTGKENFEEVLRRYQTLKTSEDKIVVKVYPYFERIGLIYAVSNLSVCRAGASTLAEITATGLPAILIPYPYATGAHQEKNAQILVKNGAARLILDSELRGKNLFETVTSLIFDDKILGNMRENSLKLGRPEAAPELAKLALSLAKKRGNPNAK